MHKFTCHNSLFGLSSNSLNDFSANSLDVLQSVNGSMKTITIDNLIT